MQLPEPLCSDGLSIAAASPTVCVCSSWSIAAPTRKSPEGSLSMGRGSLLRTGRGPPCVRQSVGEGRSNVPRRVGSREVREPGLACLSDVGTAICRSLGANLLLDKPSSRSRRPNFLAVGGASRLPEMEASTKP